MKESIPEFNFHIRGPSAEKNNNLTGFFKEKLDNENRLSKGELEKTPEEEKIIVDSINNSVLGLA